MHLFRLFDYNGPARLSLNTSEIFSYSFPSLIVGHNGAQWAHDNVQWRPGHRPSVCSGAKLWSGPGHLQGRASLSLVTYRGGPHVPGHLQGRASYLVLCAAQCLVTD